MNDSLKERIARHIRVNGPLPLAEYMHWCMADRKDGYYQSENPIGSSGDFITAPEVSQMFGELLAIHAIKTWNGMGEPESFNLVELGPGRGTLMHDLLRAAMIVPEFHAAANVCMIETGEQLRASQQTLLQGHRKVKWYSEFQEVPQRPTIVVANEFLDVLPIRQYVKSGKRWLERCVGLDADENLIWVLDDRLIDPGRLSARADDEPDGSVFEFSPAREAFMESLSDYLLSCGAASALFIDYGHAKSGFGDTFQAVKQHAYADPLREPGTADLTSHVDFKSMGIVAEAAGMKTQEIQTQGEFLLSLGLLERAGALGAGKDEETQTRIRSEVERLASPDEMGELFKVLIVSTH